MRFHAPNHVACRRSFVIVIVSFFLFGWAAIAAGHPAVLSLVPTDRDSKPVRPVVRSESTAESPAIGEYVEHEGATAGACPCVASCCEFICDIFDPGCCSFWSGACQDLAEDFCDPEDCPQLCPGAGDCCSAHNNGGCNDSFCCDLVCTQMPFCCEGVWTATCAGLAAQLCDLCETCPGPESCCVSHDSAGCSNESCCQAVCEEDPLCCDRSWDSICVARADCVCSPLCEGGCPGEGSCCSAHETPGCREAMCCGQVCEKMPSCCTGPWNAACVEAAQSISACGCDEVCRPDAGDCCEVHGTPGCNDPSCCAAVCAEPDGGFCCNFIWDFDCVLIARDVCGGECSTTSACPGSGDCCETSATAGCENEDCCTRVCDMRPQCCTGPWTSACVALAEDFCGGVCVALEHRCCFDDGRCEDLNPECCTQQGGSLTHGFCTAPQSCCLPDGTCENIDSGCCGLRGGASAEGLCEGVRACCLPDGSCAMRDFACCRNAGGNSVEGECGPPSACCLPDGSCENLDPLCCAEEQGRVGEGTCDSTSCCPSGAIEWVMPPDGVVDARQPHPLNSLDPQGISKIVVMGPAGASRSCWDLCDSSESSLNSIDKVVEGPAGTYSIELLFPISAYAVTTITYLGNGATGRFTSHPGNVNGDAGSGPLDVLNIIDCLNGVNQAVTCPWGFPYSQDLDHSGGFGPSDILREIDVLNGADLLTPANGTNLPMQVPCF